MSDGTHIEWTDATWNVVNGCGVVSPGCTNCYAMKQAHRVECRRGLTMKTTGGMVWTGEVRFNEKVLLQPLRWRRPRKIFVCAHGDLFHEKVPDEWIDRVFAVMALCPQHTFQVLTKRPERMRQYFAAQTDIRPAVDGSSQYPRARGHVEQWANLLALQGHVQEIPWRPRPAGHGLSLGFKADLPWPLANVWLGTSVEDQARANERIPILLDTPAAVRWLSMEPLLGPVDLTMILVDHPAYEGVGAYLDAFIGETFDKGATSVKRGASIDWIVLGGESGPHARPMHPDWARDVRDECALAGVPFLFKQWGEWHPACFCDRPKAHPTVHRPIPGKPGCMFKCGKAAGRELDGRTHDQYPEAVRG